MTMRYLGALILACLTIASTGCIPARSKSFSIKCGEASSVDSSVQAISAYLRTVGFHEASNLDKIPKRFHAVAGFETQFPLDRVKTLVILYRTDSNSLEISFSQMPADHFSDSACAEFESVMHRMKDLEQCKIE